MLRLTLRHTSKMTRSSNYMHGLIRANDFSTEAPIAGQSSLISNVPSPIAVSPDSSSSEIVPIPQMDVNGADPSTLSVADLGYYPSDLVCQGVELLHQTSGLPYWATIVGITFVLRSMLLPVAFGAMRNSAKLANMKPEMDVMQERMKADPTRRDLYVKQLKALYEKHDCNPFKSVVFPLLQMPIFMSFFFGLRKMGDYYPELTSGGTLWFTDLTVPDPYMAMPLLAASSFLVMIELGADGMQTNEHATTMKNFMRGMAVVMVPITMNMPAAVFCYWTTANTFSISQTLLLKVPGVREALDVPLPKPPPPTVSTSIPREVTFANNPVKAILATAKGESLSKIPISDGRGKQKDGVIAPGSFAFDDKKHVKLTVHSSNPKKKKTDKTKK